MNIIFPKYASKKAYQLRKKMRRKNYPFIHAMVPDEKSQVVYAKPLQITLAFLFCAVLYFLKFLSFPYSFNFY